MCLKQNIANIWKQLIWILFIIRKFEIENVKKTNDQTRWIYQTNQNIHDALF